MSQPDQNTKISRPVVTSLLVLWVVICWLPLTCLLFVWYSRIKQQRQEAPSPQTPTTIVQTRRKGPTGRTVFRSIKLKALPPLPQVRSSNEILPYTTQQVEIVTNKALPPKPWGRLSRPFSTQPQPASEDMLELTKHQQPNARVESTMRRVIESQHSFRHSDEQSSSLPPSPEETYISSLPPSPSSSHGFHDISLTSPVSQTRTVDNVQIRASPLASEIISSEIRNDVIDYTIKPQSQIFLAIPPAARSGRLRGDGTWL